MSKRKKKNNRKKGLSSVQTSSNINNSNVIASNKSISKFDKLIRVLSVVGLLLTIYISWSAMQGSNLAFCTQDSGCDIVQSSQWSKFLGIHLSLWGVGFYALMTFFTWKNTGSRLKQWRKIWYLSFIGLAISIYLNVTSWIDLQTLCIWCLASFAIIAIIFFLNYKQIPQQISNNKNNKTTLIVKSGAISLFIILAMFVSAIGLIEKRGDPRLHDLANHLSEIDAKFYGAYWCPSCAEQKRLFSGAANKLPYVECSPSGPNGPIAPQCASMGVNSYPTWVINERIYTGIIEPEKIAMLSGFDWEGESKDKGGN